MAYDPGAINAALSAAVGDDPELVAELRGAFLDSAARVLVAIEAAEDEEGWRAALMRLRGLAASFGAVRMVALAGEALATPVADARMLKLLRRSIARL